MSDEQKRCARCGNVATREYCYPAEPWIPYCPQHPPQYATCGDRAMTIPASSPPADTCGAVNSSTGATCDLPRGHVQNHRGPFDHGIAQWPPADVGADQQNEIKCGRGHLQRQPTCPACHDVVTLFNGFLGNGFTAVDPRAPSGVADPPVTATVSEIREGDENDGPLQSVDLYVRGRGIGLLVNVGKTVTYSLGVDGKTQQSGTVAGVADPPLKELRAYVDTLRRDADDAQRRGYHEAWSALHSAATGLSQLLDAITSSPTPGNSKS